MLSMSAEVTKDSSLSIRDIIYVTSITPDSMVADSTVTAIETKSASQNVSGSDTLLVPVKKEGNHEQFKTPILPCKTLPVKKRISVPKMIVKNNMTLKDMLDQPLRYLKPSKETSEPSKAMNLVKDTNLTKDMNLVKDTNLTKDMNLVKDKKLVKNKRSIQDTNLPKNKERNYEEKLSMLSRAECRESRKDINNQFPFICSKCILTFKDAKSLKDHQKSHKSKPARFVCKLCKQRFTTKHLQDEHYKSHLMPMPTPEKLISDKGVSSSSSQTVTSSTTLAKRKMAASSLESEQNTFVNGNKKKAIESTDDKKTSGWNQPIPVPNQNNDDYNDCIISQKQNASFGSSNINIVHVYSETISPIVNTEYNVQENHDCERNIAPNIICKVGQQ